MENNEPDIFLGHSDDVQCVGKWVNNGTIYEHTQDCPLALIDSVINQANYLMETSQGQEKMRRDIGNGWDYQEQFGVDAIPCLECGIEDDIHIIHKPGCRRAFCFPECGCKGSNRAADCDSKFLACNRCWSNKMHPTEDGNILSDNRPSDYKVATNPLFEDVRRARELRQAIICQIAEIDGSTYSLQSCPICKKIVGLHNSLIHYTDKENGRHLAIPIPCWRRGEWDRYDLHVAPTPVREDEVFLIPQIFLDINNPQ